MGSLNRLSGRKPHGTAKHSPQSQAAGKRIFPDQDSIQDPSNQGAEQPAPYFRTMLQCHARFPVPVVGKIQQRKPFIVRIVGRIKQPPADNDGSEHPHDQ